MEKTLTQALSEHVRLPNEMASQFLAELKKLSAEDKEWFKKQFEIEFGYKIVERK